MGKLRAGITARLYRDYPGTSELDHAGGNKGANPIIYQREMLLLKLRIEMKKQLPIGKTRQRITYVIDELMGAQEEIQGLVLFDPT